jgi:hypothetical protein
VRVRQSARQGIDPGDAGTELEDGRPVRTALCMYLGDAVDEWTASDEGRVGG